MRLRRPPIPLLAVALMLPPRGAAADPHDPATELASLRVLPGFQVNLFASENEGVVKPIQIRFDPQGRLWVAGSTVYPQIEPGQAANDKIVVLEDTDGDGRADRSTVFADGLMVPTGLELGDGGLYVGQGNELLFLRDTDGDGRADERRVVLRGFGTGDAHQTINSFTWSPGGQLFMCQGLHAFSRVETPWGIEKLHQAGVWRLDPRRLHLDPFLDEAMGPQNPFGIAFDRWGAPILVAGNGEGVYFLTPGMTRAHERVAMKALWNTGRKFGGADFVENSHWPPANQGELVTGSYLNNSVFRFRLAPEGAGFRVEDLPPLITSTDTSFRVVDARFGPDGALYLCDWYNPIIGHYQASFRHPDRDKAHGRIWRVTAAGRPLVPSPSLGGLGVPELLERLRSPERWTRQMAKRRLSELPAAEVLPAAGAWAARLGGGMPPEEAEHALLEVAGVFEAQEQPSMPLVERLLGASNPRVRAYGAGLAGRWGDRLTGVLPLLARGVRNRDPAVRLEAVVAASYLADPQALEVVLGVTEHPMDGFLDYAAGQAIRVLKPAWGPALREGSISLGASPAAIEFLVKVDRSPDTLKGVIRRLEDPATPRASRESLLGVLAEVGTASDLGLLLSPPGAMTEDPGGLQARGLELLVACERSRKVHPSGELAAGLAPGMESKDPRVVAQAIRLAGAWSLALFRERVVQLASGDGTPRGVRLAAIESLGFYGDAALLARLAAGGAGPEVAVAAVEALAPLDLPGAARAAASLLSSPVMEGEAGRVVSVFLARQGGAIALGEGLMKGAGRPTKRAATLALERMTGSGRSEPALLGILRNAAGVNSQSRELTAGEIQLLAQEVGSEGNAVRGGEIYRRAELGCQNCHAIGGVGGSIGPDLGALGTAQRVDFIIGAVLYPQREVKEGFTAFAITTRTGDEHQGYLIRESAEEVVLRDVLLQREVRVRREAIQERRKIGSLMPPGLVDGLTRGEFRDLVRFLSELGRH
ncbi:MAG TPA: hypothetical protein DCM86_06760 [Verrucomicrobiales bacterium]|nr:hypothetical protein [Verrucomicrobiales bacterium]